MRDVAKTENKTELASSSSIEKLVSIGDAFLSRRERTHTHIHLLKSETEGEPKNRNTKNLNDFRKQQQQKTKTKCRQPRFEGWRRALVRDFWAPNGLVFAVYSGLKSQLPYTHRHTGVHYVCVCVCGTCHLGMWVNLKWFLINAKVPTQLTEKLKKPNIHILIYNCR